MTYAVLLSASAAKQLESLEPEVQKRIVSALERIRIRPERFVKKLVVSPGYRLRVGDYRVIMDIENDKLLILVIKVGHRRKIYDR